MRQQPAPAPRGFRKLLGEQRWKALLRAGSPRTYRPGAFLLRQGDPGGFLLALTSGRVKVLASERDGGEVLLTLRGAGDLVGEMAARTETHRTATVQALERCTAHHVTKADFDRFLDQHDARDELSDYLILKLSETVPYQLQQAHFSPAQRIARLFLQVVTLADPDQPDRMRVPFSQEAIANALGYARSTVAQQIAEMRASGVLGPGPRIVVADSAGLAEQAGVVTFQ
ncbi:Crp/Fnr family transcriptional regulator [Saccharopolyspora rectivirgula]|uniref:Crp/Fnr family transcriptional regulator n=1 Tax=Saccharopolyspora rectivirgula TaxID=28042 RepID=A0A073AWD8_9PSEU|nr:Crp/Fnr family transcriptional regulator [Saccharopolyspora rectivirgula]KEI43402.1 hypothetical protein GU90_16785 [Saccharopolyspora rectivirgula]